MKIIILEEVDSTHTYLKEYIKKNSFSEPLCIATTFQTQGVGSKGNSWVGKKGNLFFSFVMQKNSLPCDLPLQSASIYFSFILKQVLVEKGSKTWLKWPNDFYIESKKIGGTITTATNDLIYCGIGLNLLRVSEEFGYLDIEISFEEILRLYFAKLEKLILWKQIFSEFQIEFQKSRFYKSLLNDEKVSLQRAILNDDGSISIDNIKVFSLR
ncbi:MAG: biotin--[acetyl-CoA-carboxylase] ligase [Candidatus Marinarcus sp.]|uniref:biotin--[acetyl-CoA-carboxylase] ligase n=1 Tax=Candidatus Marinarcus sp. TaxID=3100987 RepID=UPI003AFFE9A4